MSPGTAGSPARDLWRSRSTASLRRAWAPVCGRGVAPSLPGTPGGASPIRPRGEAGAVAGAGGRRWRGDRERSPPARDAATVRPYSGGTALRPERARSGPSTGRLRPAARRFPPPPFRLGPRRTSPPSTGRRWPRAGAANPGGTSARRTRTRRRRRACRENAQSPTRAAGEGRRGAGASGNAATRKRGCRASRARGGAGRRTALRSAGPRSRHHP